MTDVIINGNDNDVTISLKRGAKGGYAWEFTIRGRDEKDVSARITALNAAYLMMYGKNQTVGGNDPE